MSDYACVKYLWRHQNLMFYFYFIYGFFNRVDAEQTQSRIFSNSKSESRRKVFFFSLGGNSNIYLF